MKLRFLMLILTFFIINKTHSMGLFGRVLQTFKPGMTQRTPIFSNGTATHQQTTPSDLPSKPAQRRFSASIKPQEHYYTKNDGSNLTQKEHKVAYDAMMNHQFPMAPYCNPHYDSTKNETKEIQKVLDKKAPGVIARWIPTTLYSIFYAKFLDLDELYTPKCLEMIKGHFNKDDKKMYGKKCEEYIAKMPNLKTCVENLVVELTDVTLNNDKQNKVAHKKFNDFLAKQMREPTQPQLDKEYFRNNITQKVIDWECQDHTRCLYPLFRGGTLPELTTNIPIIRCMHIHPSEDSAYIAHSFSYGSSLLAGLTPWDFACPYRYMQDSAQGYLLPIKKDEYKEHFFIPPFSTLRSLCHAGQYVHPRTKVMAHGNNFDGYYEVDGINKGCVESKLITNCKDRKEMMESAERMQKYIVENAVPLTPKTEKSLKNARAILAAGNAKKAGDES